jgi:hypothetical protein
MDNTTSGGVTPDARPAAPLQSNTSPCGNQPANISLTVNVEYDTFDTITAANNSRSAVRER